MYRQKISKKTPPLVNSTPITNAVPTSSYGLLSSIVQRAKQDVNSISGDERQQLESAIGTKATGEVLMGKQSVPEFKGVSSQLWGDAAIQTKLTIGEVGDKYEQEADRVAASVVEEINRPTSVAKVQNGVLQGKETQKEEKLRMKPILQRREAIAGREASTELSGEINRARGNGQPLEGGLQQSMGQAMGADFSGVRVHTDERANKLNRLLNARAFTTGQDLFFKKNEYQPGSRQGKGLIAHELTHVIQQNGIAHKLQRNGDEKAPAKITFEKLKRLARFDTTIVSKLSDMASEAMMEESDGIPELFEKFVDYGRKNFTYVSSASNFKTAFLGTSLTFNCESISELFTFLCLSLKGELKVAKRVQFSTAPTLYKGARQGGFKNQDSNVNGKEYIMYQGGHSVADIDGTLYDATTGVMPASLNDPDYVIGEKLSDKYRCNEEGAWLYKFDFDGVLHLILREQDPELGLSKYDVVPNDQVKEVIPKRDQVKEVIPKRRFFGRRFFGRRF
ncbi:MAG: DUF4157 domain-containing protein [Cyanobacteria bacterium P01_A01_bin.80]